MTKNLLTLILNIGVLALTQSGCGDDDRDRPGADGGRSDSGGVCEADSDCDDGFACTIDSCGVGGVCRHEGINERCEGEQVCETGRGCVDEASCSMDEQCDDGFSCTIDRCGVGGECTFTGVNERCEGPGATCNTATGAAMTGCTEPTGCTTDAMCDDGFACTIDACSVDNTCAHTALDERCEDGEMCVVGTGCFAAMDCTTDDMCDDDNFCNGAETCSAEFGCQPADAPRMCSDTDDCTVDSCDADANACRFACDTSRPECECPVTEAPCDGIFDITPAPMQTCAGIPGFLDPQVEYNITELEFSCVGTVLSVDAKNVPRESRNSLMTQAPRNADGTFDITAVVAGPCEETYRFTGTFTDADHFTGVFAASYSPRDAPDCTLSRCVDQSIPVSGTRR